MSSQSSALPVAWVERIFEHFAAMYGSQKVAAMWAESKLEAVQAIWAQSLGRYSAHTIGAALRRTSESGSGWPPTLPEFGELCRQCALDREQQTTPEQALARLGHAAKPDPAQARANAARLNEATASIGANARRDPLLWARQPKSGAAVRLLIRGAQADLRLRDVLAEHIADSGARIENPEAAAAFAIALGNLEAEPVAEVEEAVA